MNECILTQPRNSSSLRLSQHKHEFEPTQTRNNKLVFQKHQSGTIPEQKIWNNPETKNLEHSQNHKFGILPEA